MKGSAIINKFHFDIKPRQHPLGYSFLFCGETDSIIHMHESIGKQRAERVIML
jgi:hypothetical protein